jgi:tRNA-dihydrouridine synthase
VAEWLAPRLIDAGACMITVHGRTTEQKFSGDVRHEGIARVVEAVRKHCRGPGVHVPVIGNGDVREPVDAAEMIRRTGCDGVMIGRGALSTPWIFRDAWALMNGEPAPAAPTKAEILSMAERYFDLMLEFRSEHYAMTQIRRRISWIGKRMTPCRPLKDRVRGAKTPAEVREALAWFAGVDQAGLAPERDGDLVEA